MTLTAAEHRVVALLGEAMSIYASEVVADGRTRSQDLAEFAAHVHVLQNVVLAQSAALAHPELYRLAGGAL